MTTSVDEKRDAHMPRGLRETWNAAFGGRLDLRGGLRAHLHPFYTSVSDHLPGHTLERRRRAFPYRSLRSLVAGLEWPGGLVPTRTRPHDYPADVAHEWANKLNGVTHDGQFWYFAQEELVLWKIPFPQDLRTFTGSLLSLDPGAYHGPVKVTTDIEIWDHFGDIDFYDGLLYVVAEGHRHGMQPMVFIFDRELRRRGHAPLTAQGASGPWCAVNPLNGLLYSSQFNDATDRVVLQVYERAVIANTQEGIVGLELEHLGAMELFDPEGNPQFAGGLQGAAFSRRGHLYLSVDTREDDPATGGIMAFDMVTGRRMLHQVVDYRPWKNYTWPVGRQQVQELEGIAVLEDPRAAGVPGIDGEVHLILLDKEPVAGDDLYFKHFEIESAADRGTI